MNKVMQKNMIKKMKNDKLIFEGKYLNWERIGKGKEYLLWWWIKIWRRIFKWKNMEYKSI